MSNHIPEHEVLLLVGRRTLSAAQQIELRLLANRGLDWEYLHAVAECQGLMPLLQKQLSLAKVEVPEPVRTTLKENSFVNVRSSFYLTSALIELNRLLRKHNIRCLFFKGVVSSLLAYEDVSLRKAGDIDVLIQKDDFSRVCELLETLGYKMRPKLSPAQETAHLASHCEIQFERDEWFTVVDLHWALAPKAFALQVETDEIFRRRQVVSLGAEEVETFCIEDLILYQCLHGAKHAWRRFEEVCCLSELIRQNLTLSWDIVIRRAAETHALRRLALGLTIAKQMTDAPVPAEILGQLDLDGSIRRLGLEFAETIWLKRRSPRPIETFVYELKIMDHKRDAVWSLVRSALIPTLSDWETLSLPSSLYPVYYIYRPLRLAGSYFGRSRKDRASTVIPSQFLNTNHH